MQHTRYTEGSYVVTVEQRPRARGAGWEPVRYVCSWRGAGVRGQAMYPWISGLADEEQISADDFELEWELAET